MIQRSKRLVCLCALLMVCTIAFSALADAPVIRLIADVSELDLAFIRGSELVTNFNYPNARGIIARYTGAQMENAIRKVECTARFEGGGSVALVALPEGEWSVQGITARSIHVVFAHDSYHLGFYENGTLTDVLTGEYALDLSGETLYTFGFSISGSTITLNLPTGKTAKRKDDRVASCNGPRVILEHYLTAEDVAAGHSPAISSIYVKDKDSTELKDDFHRGDGLPLYAPTGQQYVQFRNVSPED